MDNNLNDMFLEYLVLVAEKDVNIGVTLLVNGDYISGNIISLEKYYEILKNESKDLDILIQPFINPILEAKKNAEENTLERYFIHLKDVTCLNKNINLGNIPLRIKLSDVSGFNFGVMSQN